MTGTTKKINTLPDGTKDIQTAHSFEGLPNAGERLAKTKIAHKINEDIQKKINTKGCGRTKGIGNRVYHRILEEKENKTWNQVLSKIEQSLMHNL